MPPGAAALESQTNLFCLLSACVVRVKYDGRAGPAVVREVYSVVPAGASIVGPVIERAATVI